MNTNTYYIIAGVAILFIIYLVFLQTMMKKRKQGQLEKFKNRVGNPLTEDQKRLLAFGAILFYHRGEKILEIAPDKRLDEYVYGLQQQWGITNPEDAKERLNDLLQLKRSSEFESMLQAPSPELSQTQKTIAKGLAIEQSVVEQTTSAYAWDICRAVSLAKWCYWSGHLNEDETWSIMKQAADTAKQHGKDWTDYTVSFLLGRMLQGFDLDDVVVECSQLVKDQGPSLRKIENIDVYKKYAF